ncbi:MAG: PDZ domain-containing protein, partial [Actinomycetota bacterium]|nr:PDZ domain-containing protein [Actinomycetota bacterium]
YGVSRRTLALAVGGVLLALLVLAAALRPVPYVAMRPGPVENTLGTLRGQQIVAISGRRVFPTEGQLDLTTVSVTSPQGRISLGEALLAWLDPDRVVLPRDVVYPPQQSAREAEQRSSIEMVTSQDAAAVAALSELGIEVGFDVRVHSVIEDAPAQGHLKARDVVLAVEGQRVDEAADVAELLQEVPPGDSAQLLVRRDGRRQVITTPTAESPDEPGRTIVGITVADQPRLPFEVSIELGDRIGGPSAGLMFALAIVDKLTPGALTGGLHIAGTGEIDVDGRVGPIGGIQQKIAGAADAGATVFLVPQANCAEAVLAPDSDRLRLVPVADLGDAVAALKTLNDPGPAPAGAVPSCRT